MAKRHKKHHHEEHIDETWLIPYADLLTLLLALFIVLFASANVDQKKFEQVSASIREAFHEGGAGVLDGGETLDDPNKLNDKNGADDGLMEKPEDKTAEEIARELEKEMEKLERIKNNMNKYIKEEGLETKFTTALTKKGLLITIQDGVLFESGSAEIKSQSVKIADTISGILVKEEKRDIVISGHTDNIPIRNSRYRSNWDLSAMRAINFLQAMMRNPELDAKNFSVSGYGEYHPIANNNTASGREKNRRVEVLVLPNVSK